MREINITYKHNIPGRGIILYVHRHEDVRVGDVIWDENKGYLVREIESGFGYLGLVVKKLWHNKKLGSVV